MTAIIDYGVGNLFSLSGGFHEIGVETEITNDPARIQAADRVVLPGVGAFGDAMEKLKATGLIEILRQEAEKKPFLGICLGMQLLFEKSYEYGEHAGLGFISGIVSGLREDLENKNLKVPHMGWNALKITRQDDLLKYTRDGEYVYYVHSFYAKDCKEDTLAISEYGNIAVTGVVRKNLICGTQFHPEKSGDTGLNILRAFAELGG